TVPLVSSDTDALLADAAMPFPPYPVVFAANRYTCAPAIGCCPPFTLPVSFAPVVFAPPVLWLEPLTPVGPNATPAHPASPTKPTKPHTAAANRARIPCSPLGNMAVSLTCGTYRIRMQSLVIVSEKCRRFFCQALHGALSRLIC